MSNEIINATNFWYEFDNFFLFEETDEIKNARIKIDPYGKLLDIFYYHHSMDTINTNFKNDLANLVLKDEIQLLADNMLRILDKYFKSNPDSERMAFELFAQGSLFDSSLDSDGLPRRPPGAKIHMMDSEMTGFVAWYAFIRAIIVLGISMSNERWLAIARNIALAAAIHATLVKEGRKPHQSNFPNVNQPLDEDSLSHLRNYWLNQNFDELDKKIPDMEKIAISEHI